VPPLPEEETLGRPRHASSLPPLFCPTCHATLPGGAPVKGPIGLDDAAARVLTVLASGSSMTDKLTTEVQRFLRSVAARGAIHPDDITDDLVADYLDEVTFRHNKARYPSSATMNTRRWAVRAFFEEARRQGLTDRAVGIDLPIPARGTPQARPLTDAELWACEQAARLTLFETRAPAVLALAEAGGDAAEIAAVLVADVDLGEGAVTFTGSTRQRCRTNVLNAWGTEMLARHLSRMGPVPPETPLVVSPGVVGPSATASISGELGTILNHAGLTGDPRVRPRSVRAWSALKVWQSTHDFAAVANWLGSHSLDQAAQVIGIEWRLP